jgi:23S rRNA (guanosine2251-2'-O)-methyltransferase
VNEQSDFIFGLRPLIEAIKAGKSIDKVLMQNGLKGEIYSELKPMLKENNIPFQQVQPNRLSKYTNKNHQGIVAFISPITFHKLGDIIPQIYEQGEIPLFIILDRITDVRNFGAIVRSAECAGVHAIIVPEVGAAKIGNDATKTSAGAIFNIPICKEKTLYNTLKFLHNSGIQTVGCTEKGDKNYFDIDLTIPTAIVMGSEEDGISSGVLENVNHKALIPINGKTESLNVSVAAGIITYDVIRQRSK